MFFIIIKIFIQGGSILLLSEEFIQKVKEENDIVDIISEKVKLKRTGRNYMGLCPFHHEKSPSFSVSQDKQIYKCFGCGEAGNVITFIMKINNITFPEAVKILAEKANIDFEDNDNNRNSIKAGIKEKLYAINVDAARYFLKNLQNINKARDYFSKRGITLKTMRSFGLGYSLDSWNALLNYMKRKGYSELDLLNAGLIIKNQRGGYYDRFRNRTMFPVFDYRGKVIGFGGRVLDDSKPKYLNSPETPLFIKGTNLYGLNFAIKNNNSRSFIMVEGYMDCISLHQFGITNTVASLGTALTLNQAKLLKRFADKVIISYDADTAGQSATLRGLDILKKVGFEIFVLTVPQGKDPDEFIRNNGREAFLKLIDEALPLIDYRLKNAKQGINIEKGHGAVKYAENAVEIIAELDSIEKDFYINKLSEETNIKIQALYDIMNEKLQKKPKNDEQLNIENDFGSKLYLEPPYLKAERGLLNIMLNNAEAFEYIANNFHESELIIESHKKIYALIKDNIEKSHEELIKFIETNCNDVESSKEWVIICETQLIYDETDWQRLADDFIREIRKFKLEESKKEIMNKIKLYENEGRFEECIKFSQQLQEIQKKLGGII